MATTFWRPTGQVIDVLVSARRDAESARRFFHRALTMLKVTPRGHAFMQNLRRGHYGLAADAQSSRRVAAAFAELSMAI